MYTSDPIPRPAGPPASVTPLRDHLARVDLGVDDGYLVLPRSLAEAMPLPWQRQMAYLVSELLELTETALAAEIDWPPTD